MRWAMMLRCTSEVPEAMGIARAISYLNCHSPSSITGGAPRQNGA
jgi:hypothetical protein